jgi:cell division protein FtsL
MTAPVLDPIRSAPATAAARPRPRPAPPVKRAPARPELRVVREEERREADRARFVRQLVVAATMVGALCLFGVVVFHVLLTQNQFRLDKLQEQSLERQAEYDRLRLQVAELESPDRIIASAQALGMVTPPKVTYLAPTVEEPGGDIDSPALTADTGGESSWSTVKPHLADG